MKLIFLLHLKTTLLDAFHLSMQRQSTNYDPNLKDLKEKQSWIEDYALFMAIKETQDLRSWTEWPIELKTRDAEAIAEIRKQLGASIEKHKFNQFLFFKQWRKLRDYAHSKGIQIIGDMPFVISMDSADVWANPELFARRGMKPTFVAGYHRITFQSRSIVGNPLYNWQVHQESNFAWWVARLRSILELVDMVRLDHFRGFAAAWHVPFGNETAIQGEWIHGPAMELFTEFKRNFPDLPIIAEDLGVITPDVENLRDSFALPGMKVLQFAFSGDPEDDFLHHYPALRSLYRYPR